MLGVVVRIPRPAADIRRRSFVLVGISAALSLGFSLGTWPDATSAAAGSVPLDPSRPRAAIRRHLATLRSPAAVRAATGSPSHATTLERLLNEAERITAYESRVAPVDRTPGRVEEAWHRATRALWESAREHSSQRAGTQRSWEAMRQRLTDAVNDAEMFLRTGSGLGYREARALSGAKFQRDLAQRRVREGDFAGAVSAAEQAITLASVVETSWRGLQSRFQEPGRLRRWRQWVDEAVDTSRHSGEPVIVVNKLARKVEVFEAGRRVATFRAELGSNGLKEKRHAGDKATPEGRYRVTEVRDQRRTQYYKALLLDYPNAEDLARFREEKRRGLLPSRATPGGLIEIHGDGGEGRDWTDGCVALRNDDMDRLFRWSRTGTPVVIVGAL